MSTQMESWPRPHRITVHEYHRMAEVGLLAPDARVELIEGEIIDMAPIGRDHQSIVDQLAHVLMRACGDDAIVRGSSTWATTCCCATASRSTVRIAMRAPSARVSSRYPAWPASTST